MNWYAKTISHQGLVIDEDTGANIAVTYDKAHAPLVATAPRMKAVLEAVRDEFELGEQRMEVFMHMVTKVLYDLREEEVTHESRRSR